MSELARWWGELALGWRLALSDVGIIAGALIVGKILAVSIRGVLREKGFDEYLRHPWTTAQTLRHVKPSDVATYLCVGTLWAGALWWIASQHGLGGLADLASMSMKTAWIMSLVIFASALVAGWLARVVYTVIQSPWLKEQLDARFPSADGRGETFSQSLGRAVTLVIYAVVFLLALITIADLFRLATIGGTTRAIWEFALRLFTAAAALGVGLLGVTWARKQTGLAAEGERAGDAVSRYVGLGIIAGTVLFAVVVLIGSASLPVGALIVVLIALLLWPLRGTLLDLWSGLLLRLQQVKTVGFQGGFAAVRFVGPLMTELTSQGEEIIVRNREVLGCALRTARKTSLILRTGATRRKSEPATPDHGLETEIRPEPPAVPLEDRGEQ